MSDNFLYSEDLGAGTYSNLVTADDLNNIAKDLGAATFSNFSASTPTAVTELNNITKELVSKGVLKIEKQCAVRISGSYIYIDTGVCVFENGAKKRITSTTLLSFINGYTNYVYLLNNVSGNQIQLITSKTLPEDGTDYVMLAEISPSKTVTDKREFATYKIELPENVYVYRSLTIDFGSIARSYNIDTGNNKWKYVMISFSDRGVLWKGFVKILNNESTSILLQNTLNDWRISCDCTRTGQIITFTTTETSRAAPCNVEFVFA